jgi:hypothetical protein
MELVDKLRSDCVSNGASFEGNHTRGELSGMGFRASYRTEGPEVSVNVSSIPFFLSWGHLEREITKRAADYGAARMD